MVVLLDLPPANAQESTVVHCVLHNVYVHGASRQVPGVFCGTIRDMIQAFSDIAS